MIKKKQKLQMLKQAVIHMKKQLAENTQNKTQETTQKGRCNKTSKNKHYINWHTDRDLADQKQKYLLKSHMSKGELETNQQFQRKQTKYITKKHQSNMKNIMQTVNSRFYKTKSTIDQRNQRKSASRTKIPQMQSLVTLTSLTDRKYYRSTCSEASDKENEQSHREVNFGSKNNLLLQQRNRIKIFSVPFNHPILFPTEGKNSGKKIVKRTQKSPNNFLVSHPKFDHNLKFYGNVGIVSQSKGQMASDRNRSLVFQRISSVRQGRSCSKRHFGRYFEQQYSSCI